MKGRELDRTILFIYALFDHISFKTLDDIIIHMEDLKDQEIEENGIFLAHSFKKKIWPEEGWLGRR